MTVYAFAFLRCPEAPLNLPLGINTSVDITCVGDLAALTESGISIDSLQNDDNRLMQAILAHDRVLRAIFEQTVILPLRFGTCFVSGDRLVEHLQSHTSDYLASLDSLRGKAEYMLKAIPIELEEDETTSSEKRGKAYLLEKKKRYQAQSAYQQKQHDEFDDLLQLVTQEYRCTFSDTQDSEIKKINILHDRQEESTLLKTYHQWRERYKAWELHLSEALPPYHFISDV